jgi:Rrf2 family protein
MLSKKCQYAIHALIYIATNNDNFVRIADISEAKNIPKKFLEVILLELNRSGILGSKKGNRGGYYLRKKAKEVYMIDVIRLIDGAVAMLPCVSLNYYQSCDMCLNEKNCQVHNLFGKVRDETLKILSRSSLSDLISKKALN